MAKKTNKYTVCELFAGVGGFRLGLEKSGWETIWANQWEPGKKEQHAFNCYVKWFGEKEHINEDIALIKDQIPDHTLLVGGFPCQDYSVATTNAHGIHGKKGVLWWHIDDIIQKNKPKFILLENVDRLLRSPAKQRGRDFGIILACLKLHGYTVEWRVINAADYGLPQRRRRVFIFATKEKSVIKRIYRDPRDIIGEHGFFAQEFPVKFDDKCSMQSTSFKNIKKKRDLVPLSDDFEFHFSNAGVMVNGNVYTVKVIPMHKGKKKLLRDVLDKDVDETYYISVKELKGNNGWKYFKGAKNEERRSRKGYVYRYTEGAISFPDRLNAPSRTMLTCEGNKRPNRIAHVIEDPRKKRLRVLTPTETERLNGFPPGWTDTGMPLRWRYFCMGNALVVGLIERMGRRLRYLIEGQRKAIAPKSPHLYVKYDRSLVEV